MKKEIDRISAVPSKRIFHSIIADYDLNRSICELVDNGLDVWVRNKKAKSIRIDITLDDAQQTITVEDNAGGLPKSDLRYIVGPGVTGTYPTDETIGIFGVGTKRAVVALAQDVKITTRFLKEKTYQIDFDDEWLKDDDWDLPVYEVDVIEQGKTVVELQKLRSPITEERVAQLKDHLRTTYARFLTHDKVTIRVNKETLAPIFFENWSYPPGYPPQRFTGILKTEDERDVRVEAIAGLSTESSPAAGEYGVYFYCNDRLVARAIKTFEVGFVKGLAGLPHPKISLTRVLVFLNGDARSMPWNSSKSDINTKHEVGTIKEVTVTDFPTVKKSFLPPLPRSRPRYAEVISQKNRKTGKRKPWTKGLYEGVIAADLISKTKLEQRNRIALIVLDSTLEIGFKEYLVNESGTHYGDAQLLQLFKNRSAVQNEVKKYPIKIKADTWKKIDHYYNLRCKLVHEKTTAGVTDEQIEDFRSVVEGVLGKLYKLKFNPDST